MTPLDESLDLAAQLCRRFEGFSATPYLCPAGYATIGYGTVFKPDGTRVTLEHPPIARAEAEAWLLSELRATSLAGVLKASPGLIAYPKALGAMTDFAYNLGVARYRASTLRRRVDACDWSAAREELMRWTRGGGKVLPGLVKRRRAERALIG